MLIVSAAFTDVFGIAMADLLFTDVLALSMAGFFIYRYIWFCYSRFVYFRDGGRITGHSRESNWASS